MPSMPTVYFGYGVFITQRRSLEKSVKVMIRAAMGRYQERAHIYRKVERGRLLDGGVLKTSIGGGGGYWTERRSVRETFSRKRR